MQIGVISDTHITDLADGLAFLNHLSAGVFADVDLILHAGDIVHPDLLYCFDDKPIFGVRGNCDEPSPELPEKRILTSAGFRIGIIHGWGGPSGIVQNVLTSFPDEALDVLVFGHSHYPLSRHNGDLLLFNPGSATERREAPYHSVGILSLGASVSGQMVNLDASLKSDKLFRGVSP